MGNKGLNLKLDSPHVSAKEIHELKKSFQAEYEKTAAEITPKKATEADLNQLEKSSAIDAKISEGKRIVHK